MTTVATSSKLTIFEGPDGAGKTMAAKEFARITGARYVHFPSLPLVGKGLARMYVEAMAPALLGYQDVVFDRCWLSELPYGMAFRGGKLRLKWPQARMLSRLAMRCGAVVIRCQPSWETVKQNYLSRKSIEMLENEDQLNIVYNIYETMETRLPTIYYNYTERISKDIFNVDIVDSFRAPRHPLSSQSAGDWRAETILVGEAFGERKDYDPWYQWPFASFSNSGCSQWLTEKLEICDIDESQLLWFNADQDLSYVAKCGPYRTVIALGSEAYNKLKAQNIQSQLVHHPQYWMRFRESDGYELMEVINSRRN